MEKISAGKFQFLNLPSHHSITSSARASSVGGTSRSSALAVLRLITISYLVGACTGTPRVTRVAVLRESAIASGPAQFGVIQAVAPLLGVELRPVDVRDGAILATRPMAILPHP